VGITENNAQEYANHSAHYIRFKHWPIILEKAFMLFVNPVNSQQLKSRRLKQV